MADFVETSDKLKYIRENVPELSRLIQLGEECAELSAAIFKLCRKLRNDNPTPAMESEIKESIKEEFTDIQLCMDVLFEDFFDENGYEKKLCRWVERLKGVKS